MKNIFFIAVSVFLVITGYSQNIPFCGADEVNQQYAQQHPQYQELLNNFNEYWKKNYNSLVQSKQNQVIYVPVVFHILHENGPENIPDSLIYQEIEIMNECFRKLPGTPGDGNGVDTEIQFCLATIDPNGNPTTGITRTQTPYTNLSCYNIPWSVIFWNDTLKTYLNIWIVKSFSCGWSGFGGTSCHITVRYDCVGRNSNYDGKVVVHEAGHFFDLGHTFSGGCGDSDCSSSGDRICDTPPVASPNHGCPAGINSCTNDVPDLTDQVENYMDYTNCMNMFTQGQKARMRAFIDQQLYMNKLTSEENLYLTGACYPCTTPPCPPFAHFKADKTFAFISEQINFTDVSYNTPTSWLWSFPGGTPSNSIIQNPSVIYDSSGFHDVTLIISNAAGSDTISMHNYIRIGNPNVSSVGGGTLPSNTGICDMIIYNNELYIGGAFTSAGGISAQYVAKWNGNNWDSVVTGIIGTGYDFYIFNFEIYNNELYAQTPKYIFRLDNNNWLPIDTTSGYCFYDIKTYSDELYIADDSIIKKWNGTNMTTVGISMRDTINGGAVCCLGEYNNMLYAGGDFLFINGIPASMIAGYDGINWTPLGTGADEDSLGRMCVEIMQAYKNELYVGGYFLGIGGVNNTYKIAKWNGINWSAVGTTSGFMNSPNYYDEVYTMGVMNDELYISGKITGYIAKWNGYNWISVYPSVDDWPVSDFEEYNNELYAAGWFHYSGGILVNHIVKLGCDSLNVSFTQSADTVDLGVSGDVQFTALCSNADYWYWDFGDGATDTMQNPVHTYWNEGVYTVSLMATKGNCTNKAMSTVVAEYNCYPLVVSYDQNKDTVQLLINDTVKFYSWSMFYNSLLWNFGDGMTDTVQNPTHAYNTVGNYEVSLTAYRDSCSNTSFSDVFVCAPISVGFTQSTDTIFTGDTLNFVNNSTYISDWLWNFGDNTIDSLLFDPSHIYDSVGTYNIQLTAGNPCYTDTFVSVIVVELETGIHEYEGEIIFSLYPNPNNGNMQVDYQIQENETGLLQIYDIVGRKISAFNLQGGKHTLSITDNNLGKGIYFYKTTIKNILITTGKIVVIK